MNEFLSRATPWIAVTQGYLRDHWRESGLIGAMVIASALLFWALGKRSRQPEPAVRLDVEVAPEEFEAALQQATPGEAAARLRGAPLPSPAGRPLLSVPLPAPEMRPGGAAPSPPRTFATLREAIDAMEAEQGDAIAARGPLKV